MYNIYHIIYHEISYVELAPELATGVLVVQMFNGYKAFHRSSECCRIDPRLGSRNRFPVGRPWRTFIDHVKYSWLPHLQHTSQSYLLYKNKYWHRTVTTLSESRHISRVSKRIQNQGIINKCFKSIVSWRKKQCLNKIRTKMPRTNFKTVKTHRLLAKAGNYTQKLTDFMGRFQFFLFSKVFPFDLKKKALSDTLHGLVTPRNTKTKLRTPFKYFFPDLDSQLLFDSFLLVLNYEWLKIL